MQKHIFWEVILLISKRKTFSGYIPVPLFRIHPLFFRRFGSGHTGKPNCAFDHSYSPERKCRRPDLTLEIHRESPSYYG